MRIAFASAVTDIHYIANKSIHNDMKTTEILKGIS